MSASLIECIELGKSYVPNTKFITIHPPEPFTIAYELVGAGSEKVLMIMGLHSPGAVWRGNIEMIMRRTSTDECCSEGLTGFIRGMPKKKRFTTKEMAQDAVELLDHLGWDRAHVIGISMGGMIAQELCFLLRDRIKSLSLSVTHMGGVSAVPPFEGLKHFLGDAFRSELSQQRDLMYQLFSEEWLARRTPDGQRTMFDVALEDFQNRIRKFGHAKGESQQMLAVLTHRLDDERLHQLKSFGIPIQIIAASGDRLVRPSNSYHLRDPQDFVDFPNCGHAVLFECFDEYNDALLRHLQRNSPAPSPIPTPTPLRMS